MDKSPGSRASCPCACAQRQVLSRGCLRPPLSWCGSALQRKDPQAVSLRSDGLRSAGRWRSIGRGIQPQFFARRTARPASAISPGPSQTPPCGLHARRARVRGSQEWSGTRSRISNSRNSRSDRESDAADSSPRSESIPRSSPPGAYGSSARVAPKAPPSWPRNRARQDRLREAVKPPYRSDELQAVVKYMTWRARHLRPAHHQVPLTILLLSHRHQRTPLQARTPENQTMPTSSREDFVNGLLCRLWWQAPRLRSIFMGYLQ